MRLLLTGRQVEITPTLRRLVDARLAKLERRFERRARVGAVRAVEGKKPLRGRADGPRTPGSHPARPRRDGAWGTSLTAAVQKVIQQADKLKGKWQERKRSAALGSDLAPGGLHTRPTVATPGMTWSEA